MYIYIFFLKVLSGKYFLLKLQGQFILNIPSCINILLWLPQITNNDLLCNCTWFSNNLDILEVRTLGYENMTFSSPIFVIFVAQTFFCFTRRISHIWFMVLLPIFVEFSWHTHLFVSFLRFLILHINIHNIYTFCNI